MTTDPKKTKPRSTARQATAGGFVYVAYKGNSSLSLPAPGHGHSYVFEPMPVKNKVETSVWDELSDARSGRATPYIEARKMRRTSAGDGFDVVKPCRKIPITKAELPQAVPVDSSKDALVAQLQANLQERDRRIDSLLARLEQQTAEKEVAPVKARVPKPEPARAEPAPAEGDDEGNDSGDEASAEVLDPADYNAKAIKKAIKGLKWDALEAMRESEANGKNRPAVLAILDAALDKAMAAADEEQSE